MIACSEIMPRRNSQSPVANLPLLPLLAVFLCALGALATLVYGFEREGRIRAIEAAKLATEAQSQGDDLAAERESLDWRITQLQQARETTQVQLAEKQQELSHVEDHLRRLRARADQVRIAAEELEHQGNVNSPASQNAAEELERLRRAIIAAEQELKRQEQTKRNAPVTYSVVPYEGPNQTKRRPIYIECRLDAVLIQPEGIALRESDFEPPLGPGNPLAAAIRAYSEYLARMGFTGETTRPYPMLLVRPDGIVAYYAARAALESWGTEFGYELIGDDWKLEMPSPDGQLATGLEQVVVEARMRQEALAMAAPRQFKRPRGAMRASPNGRGFVAEGGYERGSPYGGSGFAERRGRSSGFGSGDSPGGRSAASGFGNGAATPEGPGPGYSDGIGADSPLPSMSGGSGLAGNSGNGNFGGGTAANRPGGTDLAASGGSRSNDAFGQNQPPASGDGFGSLQGPPGNGTSGGEPGPQLGNAGAEPSGTAGEGTGAPPGGRPGAANGASRNQLAGQPGGNGKNELGPMGSPGQGFQSNADQQAAQGSGSARTGGSPGSANSPSSGGSESAAGDDQQSPPSAVAHVTSDNRKKSLAGKRGADWGLPDAASHMTPVTRPVIIRCEPNRLTIVPDDNHSLPKTVPLGARTEDSVDQLVSGVWDHMKGWGLAGRGMYWRPNLVMEVAPGAETRFSELQALLAGSGMEVKARQRR